MRTKSLKIPSIIIAAGLVLAVIAYLLTGILKEPTITEHDFNYSATYKLNGETKTLNGTYRCIFSSGGEGITPLERYYDGFYPSAPNEAEPKEHTIDKKDDLELRIVFIFTPDYLMGDGDFREKYSEAIPDPYLAVYDREGYEYSDSEHLSKFDAELISWETPQPIENSFTFSGISRIYDGSMLAMLLVGILVIIACAIFVKKADGVSYKVIDIISIIFNFIVGMMVLPFITLVAYFMGIYVGGDELAYQIDLCIPAFTAFTIAASMCLRRKGFRKTGFFIQFIGPVIFAATVILDSIIG